MLIDVRPVALPARDQAFSLEPGKGRAQGGPAHPQFRSQSLLGWQSRIGCVMPLFDPAAQDLLKLAADTQCSTLNMAATAAYLDRFDIDAHIDVLRDVLADRGHPLTP